MGRQLSQRVLAGVDIGTLTCRLLIAELTEQGRLRERKSERRILRLGEGVDRERMLQSAAIDRVLGALKKWKTAIDGYGIDAVSVVATSAVRDAKNRQEFVDRVKREVGYEVEVITGEEEARRTMLGIRSGLPAGVHDVLALDIGGGSTEFILDRPGQSPIVRSIDIGVVRLSERILHHDPPGAEEIRQAHDWVRQETQSAIAKMPRRADLAFVGTAGTITTLAAMAQELRNYEPARIHNYVLKLPTIQNLERELLSRTIDERRGLPGLERGREDVIVAGVLILRTVMEILARSDCLVSDRGLREGVILDLASRIGEHGARN